MRAHREKLDAAYWSFRSAICRLCRIRIVLHRALTKKWREVSLSLYKTKNISQMHQQDNKYFICKSKTWKPHRYHSLRQTVRKHFGNHIKLKQKAGLDRISSNFSIDISLFVKLYLVVVFTGNESWHSRATWMTIRNCPLSQYAGNEIKQENIQMIGNIHASYETTEYQMHTCKMRKTSHVNSKYHILTP